MDEEDRTPSGTRPAKIAEGREAEIFSWGEHEVLRLLRDPGASDAADRELAAMISVRRTLPCVPEAYGRIDWDGRPGIRMQRIEGHGILAELQRRPWRVWDLGVLCGRVHGDLNRVPAPDNLPELGCELRRRIETGDTIPSELRSAALEELDRLPEGSALCHGDFQPENVLLSPTGPIVIDWPLATRGDPCGDFARTALMMKVGALAPGTPALIRASQGIGRGIFLRAYVAGYEQVARYERKHIESWKFVRAVERLADDIPEERRPLLRAAGRLRRFDGF